MLSAQEWGENIFYTNVDEMLCVKQQEFIIQIRNSVFSDVY